MAYELFRSSLVAAVTLVSFTMTGPPCILVRKNAGSLSHWFQASPARHRRCLRHLSTLGAKLARSGSSFGSSGGTSIEDLPVRDGRTIGNKA